MASHRSIAGLFSLMSMSCTQAPQVAVHFVLPDAYRGAFTVGAEPSTPTPPIDDGRLVLAVPESGRLQIPDTAPLEQWHQSTAATRSGTPLPIGSDQADPAVFYVAARADGSHWFFVGSRAGYDELLRDPFSIKPGHRAP